MTGKGLPVIQQGEVHARRCARQQGFYCAYRLVDSNRPLADKAKEVVPGKPLYDECTVADNPAEQVKCRQYLG